MPSGLTDDDWETLLQRIHDKECTPFIGAGACTETLPLASELAREWAAKYDYPLADATNLARVAQFLAVEKDPMFPKGVSGGRSAGTSRPTTGRTTSRTASSPTSACRSTSRPTTTA